MATDAPGRAAGPVADRVAGVAADVPGYTDLPLRAADRVPNAAFGIAAILPRCAAYIHETLVIVNAGSRTTCRRERVCFLGGLVDL